MSSTTASAVTLQRHAAERVGGDLAVLLGQVSFAARIVAREPRLAPPVGRLGTAGSENPTGDSRKERDLYTDRVFLEAFGESRLVAIGSRHEVGGYERSIREARP